MNDQTPLRKLSKLTIGRLLKLSWLLENLATEFKNSKFDMGIWAQVTKCRTAACAVGWAAQHSWFTRRGFHLNTPDINGECAPLFRDERGDDAVTSFFNLSCEEARYLFYTNEDGGFYKAKRPRPATVARVICEFVAARS